MCVHQMCYSFFIDIIQRKLTTLTFINKKWRTRIWKFLLYDLKEKNYIIPCSRISSLFKDQKGSYLCVVLSKWFWYLSLIVCMAQKCSNINYRKMILQPSDITFLVTKYKLFLDQSVNLIKVSILSFSNVQFH